jgi:hypothetical protein
MRRLLERSIAVVERRLVLLAPPEACVAPAFQRVTVDPFLRETLVTDVQRMRGSVYLADGAVTENHLSVDGLHQTPEDARSWHLLFLNAERRVTACVWYLQHDLETSYNDLRVRYCPLGGLPEWREKLAEAVESELTRARAAGLHYAEVGGWAVSKESRCTSEGLLLALAAYSLGRILGGALGMTTATVRHSSSAILRRLGGSLLEAGTDVIPSYHDPKYGCTMELLRFDSRQPHPKYASLVDMLCKKLATVPVVAAAMQQSPVYADGNAVPLYAA